MELPNVERGKAEDADIEDDIRYAGHQVHDRVDCRGLTVGAPVAVERPSLEEGCEEEGDEPGDDDDYQDCNGNGEAAEGEDSAVEAKDSEFNKGDRGDVPELEGEKDLEVIGTDVQFVLDASTYLDVDDARLERQCFHADPEAANADAHDFCNGESRREKL